MRLTSSPMLRRAATIKASATVPAEIITSVSVSKIFMQASASFSPSAIAISAEVSTAIIEANHLASRQTIRSKKEVLAPSCAFSGPRLGGPGGPYRLEELPALLGSDGRFDGHQPHRRLAVPGQNDLFPCFGAADQFRQLRFGVGHCNPHRSSAPKSASGIYGPASGPYQTSRRSPA